MSSGAIGEILFYRAIRTGCNKVYFKDQLIWSTRLGVKKDFRSLYWTLKGERNRKFSFGKIAGCFETWKKLKFFRTAQISLKSKRNSKRWQKYLRNFVTLKRKIRMPRHTMRAIKNPKSLFFALRKIKSIWRKKIKTTRFIHNFLGN